MIKAGVCIGAKKGFLSGQHNATDRYMVALYTEKATLSPDTLAYTNEGEVVGGGYLKGGQAITDWAVGVDGTAAKITFSEVFWKSATMTARGALIYNDSQPGLPAVAVLDFGQNATSVNGPFTVALPDGESILTLD